MSEPLIEVSGVSVGFGDHVILRDLDFDRLATDYADFFGRIDVLLSARLHLALNDSMRAQLLFDHVLATAMGDFSEQRYGLNVYVHRFFGGVGYATRGTSVTEAGFTRESRWSEWQVQLGMTFGGSAE